MIPPRPRSPWRHSASEADAPASSPLQTLTTAGHQSLIDPGDLSDLEHELTDDEIWAMVYDSEFRMLEPYEVKRGMAFPGEHVLLGNKREQVRMVGNAVTPNAARDLIAACVDSPGYTVRRHYDLVA